jgi:hypothetical protein
MALGAHHSARTLRDAPMGGRVRHAANLVNRSAVAARSIPDLAQRKPCLLVNPRSFNAAHGDLAARAVRLAREHGASVLEATDATQIAAALDVVAATPARPLFVLAGDGTVQALVDRLATLPDPTAAPQLFVLGGGRSNLTAADLGGSGAVLGKLECALRRWRDGPAFLVETREVLRIEQPPLPPRHGFFLAAGLLDHIIRACHREHARHHGGLRGGDGGTVFIVLRFALAALLRREPPIDELQLSLPGANPLPQPARLLIVTTLENSPGMPSPVGRGAAGLRFVAVTARGTALWMELARLAITRGRPGGAGGRSRGGRSDALQLRGLSSYTLDGEEFQADPARPVLIRTGPPVAFLTL